MRIIQGQRLFSGALAAALGLALCTRGPWSRLAGVPDGHGYGQVRARWPVPCRLASRQPQPDGPRTACPGARWKICRHLGRRTPGRRLSRGHQFRPGRATPDQMAAARRRRTPSRDDRARKRRQHPRPANEPGNRWMAGGGGEDPPHLRRGRTGAIDGRVQSGPRPAGVSQGTYGPVNAFSSGICWSSSIPMSRASGSASRAGRRPARRPGAAWACRQHTQAATTARSTSRGRRSSPGRR
jgi:hypothetical protein